MSYCVVKFDSRYPKTYTIACTGLTKYEARSIATSRNYNLRISYENYKRTLVEGEKIIPMTKHYLACRCHPDIIKQSIELFYSLWEIFPN